MSFQESILFRSLLQSQVPWTPGWAILLSQYDMTFVPQKAIKSQALTDFLAAHPISESSKLYEDIPDEVIKGNITSSDYVWQLFFDGASRTRPKGKIVTGVGVYLSHRESRPSSCILANGTLFQQYSRVNALLICLQLAQQIGLQYLKAYGDSKLITNQVKGENEAFMKASYLSSFSHLVR